jgi:hypothetical protein
VPSLPIILLSVLAGLGTSALVLYAIYTWTSLSLAWSVAVATLALTGSVAGTAFGLSALHDPRSGVLNVGFSCGFTLLLLLFLGFCLFSGMLAATFFVGM